jgi:uncharacterized protein (DUF2267 family)
MDSNHVGVVIVGERGRPIGLLTDRDIALRVVARGLDPIMTEIRQVMTPNPAVLPIDGAEEEAIQLMRERHVRRIPLVEGQRVAGIVTLDDLILDEGTDARSVAALVRAQLEEPASHKPIGETHPTRAPRYEPAEEALRALRHAARAERSLHHALRIIEEETGLEDSDRALTALQVVVAGLVRRITPPEAGDFLGQLPATVRERVLASGIHSGPDRGVTRESIDAEMQDQLGLDPAEASELVNRIGAALSRLVSPGEMDHVRAQLPEAMRSILAASPARSPVS